jgi:branched-chain amino acid aminotransferase
MTDRKPAQPARSEAPPSGVGQMGKPAQPRGVGQMRPSEDRTGRAVAWLDGRVVPLAEARIPITDHGLLYGDGLFEGMRIIAGRVFRLDDHLARFAAGARALGLALPGGTEAARNVVLETARAFGEPEAYVRLIATRGEGALGVDPATCPAPRLLCIVDRIALFDARQREQGLDLVTVSVRRPPADVLDPRVKSLNYLNNVLAKREAKLRGADEALVLNLHGNIAEASVANLFCARDGELMTPPATDGALEGITRRTVLELAAELGISAREQTLGRFDLFACDEAFLTGSGAGLVPVRSLDGEPIPGPGKLFLRLREAFDCAAPGMGVPFSQ